MKKIAVAIFGPTGVGKTSLAIKLAKENGEIISVDSMQVYKFLDIGTAKPDPSELKQVKHHLIDFITPDVQFSAGDFILNAEKLINDILKREKIPFLVGGTGLYFLSLMRGMADIPKINKSTREYIEAKWEKIGQPGFYKILLRLDKEYALNIHPNDKQRTKRAMEVIVGTGKKFSFYLNQGNNKTDIKFITLGLNITREELYNKINLRVDKMISAGLIDEVKKLKNKGYTSEDPGMRAIGYKEIYDYLDGKITFDNAVYLMKRNSRRYAKRQLIWFRKNKDVKWFNSEDYDGVKKYIEEQIEQFS